MRKDIIVELRGDDRARLEAIVADRNQPQKHVWRAEIILATDDGLGTAAIMRRSGKSKTAVWRWQARFMEEGVAGLLRDKTRPARKAKLPPEKIAEVVALTQGPPPVETTHWASAAIAKAASISQSACASGEGTGCNRTGSVSSSSRLTRGSLRS